MDEGQKKNYYMNRNIKLYPTYLAFTWDVFFVWTIIILFFTNVKGLSYSQAVLLDSILYISAFILSVPLTKLFSKIKPVLSSQIATLCAMIFLIIVIFGNSFFEFVIAEIFYAIFMVVGNIKNSIILSDSLHVVKRDKEFNRIYGGGLGTYYFLDAVGAIFATYIYQYNPYLAFILAFCILVLVQLFSLLLKEPSKFQENNVDIQPVKKKSVKPDSYKKILFSGFILSMLVYLFFFRGVVSIDSSALKIYLQQLSDGGVIPVWLFGILYSGYRIANSLSSKFQFKYELKFGVRSIVIFSVLSILCLVGTGVIYLISPSSIIAIVLILTLSYVFASLRPPTQIFMTKYLQVCLTKKNLERGYNLKNMAEYLGYATFSSIYALLLSVFNDNYGYTNLVYIAILAVPLIVSMIVFIRFLVKKHASKYTIIKAEYTED